MGKSWCINCGRQYREKQCPSCYPEDDRDTFTKRGEFRHIYGVDSGEWARPQRCGQCHELMEFVVRRGVTHAICRKCNITI